MSIRPKSVVGGWLGTSPSLRPAMRRPRAAARLWKAIGSRTRICRVAHAVNESAVVGDQARRRSTMPRKFVSARYRYLAEDILSPENSGWGRPEEATPLSGCQWSCEYRNYLPYLTYQMLGAHRPTAESSRASFATPRCNRQDLPRQGTHSGGVTYLYEEWNLALAFVMPSLRMPVYFFGTGTREIPGKLRPHIALQDVGGISGHNIS